jgi:hypothetical protein
LELESPPASAEEFNSDVTSDLRVLAEASPGSCYCSSHEYKSFPGEVEGREACRIAGGHLANVREASEHDALVAAYMPMAGTCGLGISVIGK